MSAATGQLSRSTLKSMSKLLSLVLRHKPETIGLTLDREGWADVEQLVQCAQAHRIALTPTLIAEIASSNDKQRFSISSDGHRIRANQGHSVAVELGLVPQEPPEVLYHGTATRYLRSIMNSGIHAGSRRHVHLSATEATARTVGARHGIPIVLTVQSARMYHDGHAFFQSENGVWLTASVPRCYLNAGAPDSSCDSWP